MLMLSLTFCNRVADVWNGLSLSICGTVPIIKLMSIQDFIGLGIAGSGSFSQVRIVKRKEDGNTYAMKEVRVW